MTNKVDIKRLDSITKNDTTATEQINDNFKALQEAIENTLSRDGTGPNFMDADLDMNSYRIINSAYPAEDNDIVNLKYVEERIGGAVEASKTAVGAATQAVNSAQSALVSSTNAINALRNAENTINQATTLLTETQEYVDAAKADIDDTVEAGKQEINTTIDDAQTSLSDTIQQSVEDVKQAALEAAQESINDAAAQATAIVIDYANNEVKPELMAYATSADEDAKAAEDWAKTSKIWATGEDAEVDTVAPGENEHSSRGYADLAMAIANTPEDVPVDASELLALDVIRGPKGDSGEAEFSGDITFTGTFDVHSDSNHPVKVTGMAGTSASGFQIVDSNGLGDSDFEHYATGDRYGTRITNHNNTSNTSVSVDLYQSNVGRSVLDTTDVETVLVPTPAADDDSQKAVNSEWVNNIVDTKTLKTSQITNCITEIPQDIKLELNNGVLTLKAGSKVYVPNGFEADGVTKKFDYVTVNEDIPMTLTAAETRFPIMSAIGGISSADVSRCSSGNTRPSGDGRRIFYKATTNLVEKTEDGGSTWTSGYSLPFCVFTGSTEGIKSLDQVFNGFGYIGSTVFALPGVKGLIPNGRNADGSLKNIEFVTSKVVTHTWGSETYGTFDLALKNDNTIVWYSNLLVKSDNYLYNGNTYLGADKLVIGRFNIKSTSDKGKIAFLSTKLPFQAVDRNDSSWLSGLGMPSDRYIDLTLGATDSLYTAPANGWVHLVIDVSAGGYLSIQDNYYQPSNIAGYIGGRVPFQKGQSFYIGYGGYLKTVLFKFFYAEGDK